jgi:hypothetical protein
MVHQKMYLGTGNFTAVGNCDRLGGLSGSRPNGLNFLYDVHTILNFAKHDVLTIKPRACDGGNKELENLFVGEKKKREKINLIVGKTIQRGNINAKLDNTVVTKFN